MEKREPSTRFVSFKLLALVVFMMSAIFVGGFGLTNTSVHINQTQIIKNPVITQTSQIVVNRPVNYTALVAKSQIKSDQYYVQLPKGSRITQVKTITAAQAKQLASKPAPSEQLTRTQRQQAIASLNPGMFTKLATYFTASLKSPFLHSEYHVLQTDNGSFVNLSKLASNKKNTFTAISTAYAQEEGVSEEVVVSEVPVEEVPVEEVVVPEVLVEEVLVEEAPVEESSAEEVLVEEVVLEEPFLAPIINDLQEILPVESVPAEETTSPAIEAPAVAGADETEVVQIDFEIPAPQITEEETRGGKQVIVSAENEDPALPELTNVLAYTTIPELFNVGQEKNIQITWTNNNGEVMPFTAHDLNGNGKIDYLEWTVPHLSQQIFDIIFISKAFRLDADKNILEDLYPILRTRDNNWATIEDGQYVRVTFETILDGRNDVTLYARTNGPLTIEVYPVDADGNTPAQPIATFSNITTEAFYKVFFPDFDSSTDTFDLKVTGTVDIDFVVDASRYWVGSAGGNTNDTANWASSDPASCTGGGASVPGASDVAIFDADCDNGATINANLDVAGINFNSGYSGTVTQSSGVTIAVGATGWTQAAGTFTGGNGAITITSGAFVFSGGTFTSTSGTLTVGADGTMWNHTAGTFVHNSGTVLFKESTTSPTITTTTDNFNNVTFSGNGHNSIRFTISATMNVLGTLTFGDGPGGAGYGINTGTINAKGDVTMANTLWGNSCNGANGDNGTATIVVNGTGTQTLSSTESGCFPAITIDKSSGTLNLSGIIYVGDDWTWTQGTLSAGSSTLYVMGPNTGAVTVTPATGSYNNVTIITNNADVTVSGTWTVAGNLLLDDGVSPADVDGGAINVAGNVTNDGISDGSTTITLNGTGAQTITHNSGTWPGSVFTINKASGTATLATNLSTNVSGQDFTITSGTLSLASFSLTVNDVFTLGASGTFQLRGAETVTLGSYSLVTGSTVKFTGDGDSNADTYAITSYFGGVFKNLVINSTDGATDIFQQGAALTATSLTITAGTFDVNSSTYTLAVSGDVSVAGTLSGSGTGNVTIAGNFTGDGTVNLTGSTVTITATGNLGGSSAWTFKNLTIGSAALENTPTFVQSAENEGGASTTTIAKAFDTNNTAGNFIVVGVYVGSSSGTATVADTAGNTYTEADSQTQTTDGHEIFIFYARNIAGGANTVTATFSGSACCRAIHIFEFSGMLASSDPLDKVASTSGDSGSAANSGNTTTTAQSSELLFGMFGSSTGSTVYTPGSTGGFNYNGAHTTGNGDSYTEYVAVNSTGTFSANATLSGNFNWSAAIATFKANTADATNSTTTATGSGGITVSGVLTTASGSTLNAGAKTWTLSGTTGTSLVNSGTFTASTSTIAYTGNNGSGNTTITNVIYNNLTLNNASETFVLGAALDVNDTITITAGALDVGSNYGITAKSWTDSGSGTFTEGSGTVTFDVAGGTITSNETFENVTINHAGTTTLGAALDLDDTLTITGGALDVSGTNYGITLKSWADAGSGTFTEGTGTVTFDITGGTITSNETFENVTINHAGTTTLGAALDLDDTLTLSGGALDVSGTNFGITLKSWADAGSGTFTEGTGTVTFDITGGTITSNETFENVTINHAGTTTLGAALDLDDTLTITSGALDVSGTNYAITLKSWTDTSSGTFTEGTGTVTFDITGGTINSNETFENVTINHAGTTTLGAALDLDDTLTLSGGALDVSGTNFGITLKSWADAGSGTFTEQGGTVTFDVAGGTITSNETFENVTINHAGTTTLGAALDLDDTLTLSGGALDVSGTNYGITLKSWTDSGSGTFTEGTGTVTFDVAGGTITSNEAFNSITVNHAGTTTVGADLAIASALTITSGTLNASTYTITLSGTGTVFNNSGTYTAGSSTITLSDTSSTSKTFNGGGSTFNVLSITGSGTGAVIVQGSNTFATFTINPPKTVTFTSGTTQTITSSFGCTGTAGNVITINASGGTAATLSKSSGTVSCDYLSLTNSTATGGATWNPGNNSTNVSGNTGWNFDTTAPSVDAGSDQSKSAIFTQDATASDAGSGISTYLWSKTSGPGTITFGTETSEDTTITASSAGTYVLTLTVTDVIGNEGEDSFTLTWTVAGGGGGGGGSSGGTVSGGTPGFFHAECQSNMCVQVPGAGFDQCSSNAQCIPVIGPIVIKPIEDLGSQIGNIFNPPAPPKQITKEDVIPFVPETTPEALKGLDLLGVNPISNFNISSIPSDVVFFAQKFPQFDKLLTEIGVDKFGDTSKLAAQPLTLPGFTQTSIFKPDLSAGIFSAFKGLPLASLTVAEKQQIPTDIIFAKTGNGFIDINTTLSFDSTGHASQKISTVAGKPLELLIKPSEAVKRVLGFVVLTKTATIVPTPQSPVASVLSTLKQYFTAGLVVAQPAAAPEEPETQLLLEKFEYTKAADGFYTANINVPLVDGDYEIITVMDYQDATQAPKQIRLITVIDPEGYVFTQLSQGKLRISGSIVSLYYKNPETKSYELWSAEKFLQKNPVITDDTGKYSFLTPEGTYYLEASAPGYKTYQSEPFNVIKGTVGIHMDLELKKYTWWPEWVNWNSIFAGLLMIVLGLLAYVGYQMHKLNERKSRA